MGKEEMMEKLFDHLGFNAEDGTYIHCLTRCKSAHHHGTMTLDDFVEVDEDFVAELADFFLTNKMNIKNHGRDKDASRM